MIRINNNLILRYHLCTRRSLNIKDKICFNWLKISYFCVSLKQKIKMSHQKDKTGINLFPNLQTNLSQKLLALNFLKYYKITKKNVYFQLFCTRCFLWKLRQKGEPSNSDGKLWKYLGRTWRSSRQVGIKIVWNRFLMYNILPSILM